MALPVLKPWERILYKDFMTIYRMQVDATGNPLGYAVVQMSVTDSTPLRNVPCNFHRTHNFDWRMAPIGMTKRVNMETSDRLIFQYAIPMQASDLVYITSRVGDSEWRMIQGAPERGVLIPHAFVYAVPTPAGTILPGLNQIPA